MPRDFSIVLFGATGYTGRLVCEYLKNITTGAVCQWAVAGRDENKLIQLVNDLSLDVPVLVADTNDPLSLDRMCSRATLLLSCVGPFSLFGMPVVEACVRHGTHYVDSTGEFSFVRNVIDKLHAKAIQRGVVIVPCCAFDCVPSDIGNYLVHHLSDVQLRHVEGYFSLRSCGVSGGTARSALALAENLIPADYDHFSLVPQEGLRPVTTVTRRGIWYDFSEGRFSGPFVMASTNERVVRRTNALLGYNSSYTEAVEGTFLGVVLSTLSFYLLLALLSAPPIRRYLANWLIPLPGTGPTAGKRAASSYRCTFFGAVEDGTRRRRVSLADKRDMYSASAMYLAEGALSVLEMGGRGELGAGVLTPMAAFGDVLVRRVKQAGVTIEVEDV